MVWVHQMQGTKLPQPVLAAALRPAGVVGILVIDEDVLDLPPQTPGCPVANKGLGFGIPEQSWKKVAVTG